MIKSDNIVKIGTRFKLCKQQSTYRESHDGDGGDWNGAGTASKIHSGIEAQAQFSPFTQAQTTFLKLFSVTMFVRRNFRTTKHVYVNITDKCSQNTNVNVYGGFTSHRHT